MCDWQHTVYFEITNERTNEVFNNAVLTDCIPSVRVNLN